jgi:hypothetical protein
MLHPANADIIVVEEKASKEIEAFFILMQRHCLFV